MKNVTFQINQWPWCFNMLQFIPKLSIFQKNHNLSFIWVIIGPNMDPKSFFFDKHQKYDLTKKAYFLNLNPRYNLSRSVIFTKLAQICRYYSFLSHISKLRLRNFIVRLKVPISPQQCETGCYNVSIACRKSKQLLFVTFYLICYGTSEKWTVYQSSYLSNLTCNKNLKIGWTVLDWVGERLFVMFWPF